MLRQGLVDRTSTVRIFLCGRGSLIGQRFCTNPDTNRIVYHTMIEGWLRDIGFERPGFQVEFTKRPKQEVALGALRCSEDVAAPGPARPISGWRRRSLSS